MSALETLYINYVSPSAIETFELCAHKWALTKIDRHPKEQSDAAALGSAFHDQKEKWLTQAVPYDMTTRAGELAQATMHLDPPPGVGTCEKEMTFVHDGVTFGGKIDLHWSFEGPDLRVAIVQDHKRTGQRQYAKLTKEALLGHPQFPIYAVYASQHYGTPWIHARWNYVEDGGPKSKSRPKPLPSWHDLHVNEALATMPRWLTAARAMLEYVRRANVEGLRARDVPKNTNSCYQFGKCQFLKNGQCRPTPPQEFTALMTQQAGPSFAELLAQHNANQAAQQAQQAPQQPIAQPVQQPQFVQQQPIQPQFVPQTVAQQPAFMGAPAPVQQPSPQFVQQPVQQPVQAPLQGVAGVPPINYVPPPPDAPAAQQPPYVQQQGQPHYGTSINPPESQLPPAPAAPLAPVLEEKPKRGRGRPAGAAAVPNEIHVSALEGQAIMTIVALVLSEVGSALIRCGSAAEQLAKAGK